MYGFIKVSAAIPTVQVGNTTYNLQQIENLIAQAEGKGVEVIVFPELSLTGYTCQDLFGQRVLLDAAERAVLTLLDFTRQLDIISIVGLPVVAGDLLLNCAAVIQRGKLLGMVPKTYLPNYSEFYEKRWFASAQDLRPMKIHFAGTLINLTSDPQIFRTAAGIQFAIEICEDVWAPTPPSNQLALAGADLIFNLSASDDLAGKHHYLQSLIAQQSARTITAYIYSGCGYGESTQDVVYGGNAMIFENGTLLCEAPRFSMQSQMVAMQVDVERLRAERRTNSTFVNAQRNLKYSLADKNKNINVITCEAPIPRDFQLERTYNPYPFLPDSSQMEERCTEITSIQAMGLAKRLDHIHCKTAVIGISGGLDSTLALLITLKAFQMLQLDTKGIIGITMPGFGTTDRTYNNALQLMKQLGVTIREISIRESVLQHFNDIQQDPNLHDVTYENAQARERTQILMDVANKEGGIVVGTGDLSELALGWATYNGDHISMYGVNAGVPKTLVRHLVRHFANHAQPAVADILLDVLDTPVSPELIPADEHGKIKQKTEDLVGPYELHDFFLYHFLRFGYTPDKILLLAQNAFQGIHSEEVIRHWLTTFVRRFFTQQFKRSCLPDGPKVGSVSLSPRGDWRMPSDAVSKIWLDTL